MKKKSNIKKNLKATVTTVTTAGILFTGVSPSYAEEQQNQTPIELTDAEAKKEKTLVDNIKENEVIQNQEQMNSNDAPATEQEEQPKGNETSESKVEQNTSIQEQQNRITDSVQDAEADEGKVVDVSTFEEFKTALQNKSVTTVNVMKNIQINEEIPIQITKSRNLTINGNADQNVKIFHSKSIKVNGAGNTETGGVTLKNAKITGSETSSSFLRIEGTTSSSGVYTIKDVSYSGSSSILSNQTSKKIKVGIEGNTSQKSRMMFCQGADVVFREGSTYTGAGTYGNVDVLLEKNAKVNMLPNIDRTPINITNLTVKEGGEFRASDVAGAITIRKGVVEEKGSFHIAGDNGSNGVLIGNVTLFNPASYSISNLTGKILTTSSGYPSDIILYDGDVNTWEDNADFESLPGMSWKAVEYFKWSTSTGVNSTDANLDNSNFGKVRKIAGGTGGTEVTVPSAPDVKEVKDTDTKVTGSAQKGAKVSVKSGETELGTGEVHENGTYSIDIPKQKAGTKLSVTASNSAGISEATEVTVQATQLEKPVVNSLTTKDKKVTGTAQPYAKIEVVTNYQKATYRGEADENGNFEVALNQPQKAGTKIGVKQSIEGKESEYTEVEVQAPLVAPEINPIYTTDTMIKGTGVANTTAIAKIGEAEFVGKVDDKGNLQIDIEDSYPVGTEISVHLKNDKGLESEVKTVKVQEIWAIPAVNEVTDQDEKITGTGTAGAEVTVKVKDGKEIGKGTVADDGTFSITIPKQKADTQLDVKVVKGENEGTKSITVKDVTPPEAPQVDDVKATDKKVTGTGEPGAKVSIKEKNGAEIGAGTVDKDGKFSVEIAAQVAGTVVSITLTDKAGNVSGAKELTVQEGIASPTINDYYTTDAYAKGTAKGASKVAIYVDGKLIRTAGVNADGTYMIYTGDIVTLQKEGAVFEIAARDAAGAESQRTQGTVLAKQAPNAPAINDYYTTDAYAKGTAKGASKVAIYVDGKLMRTAGVNQDGTYTIYTGDIVALQKEGAVFEIAARDAAGTESQRVQGTVLVKQRPEAPTISKYYTTDAYVKGTAKGASKVTIYVDGKLVRTAGVNADGTYMIYTGDIVALQKEGAVFEIAARDVAGTESKKTQGTVLGVEATMTAKSFHLGTDNYIEGTVSATIQKVKIIVDGELLRQTTVENGTYKIYARDLVKDAKQKVEIAGFTSDNQEVARTKVEVK
ncbi:Ig-like domain-containing protein [Bacillus cereus group sp. RP43]|uniref:Ig-like domain-containing protein n=1 Tax=Bacillus cereus group sp. RP43 TaxID=3040260 RepID=UPI003398D52A